MATKTPTGTPATPKNTQATTTGKVYQAQWTLYISGKQYKAGNDITLEDATAEPLLAAGVVTAKH